MMNDTDEWIGEYMTHNCWTRPTVYSEPVYIWNNNQVPVTNVSIIDYGGSACTNPDSSANYIVSNRDYFNSSMAKPGYVPFTYPNPLTQGPLTCTISPSSIGPYTDGRSISQTFTAANCNSSTFTISSGSLTGSGLTLNTATGILSGTPVAGSYAFTIAYSSAQEPISLFVGVAPPTGLQATVQ